MIPPTIHESVLADEVLHGLDPLPGQILVDGTLGGGGHTRLLAGLVAPAGFVLALDQDPQAIDRANETLQGLAVKTCQSNFRDLPEVLASIDLPAVDGILLDIGLSSDQLADRNRGFSFQADGPLDMRFNPDEGQPAWELLAEAKEEQLADLIYRYGEERFSRRIARAIVAQRATQPIQTAQALAELIHKVVPRARDTHLDPATRTFQALRIAVNDELGALRQALERSPACLKLGGKLAVISFHSLEDRLVKEAFRDNPRYEPLTKKPITASDEELQRNPRSRSAKLRIARRVAVGTLVQIISGGQTGVDRGALDAAIALGMKHGGWCPRGRLAEDGPISPRYALQETDSPLYHIRTEKNVVENDATLILSRGPLKGGTELTRKLALQHSRPHLVVDISKNPPIGPTVEWLRALRVSRLNVAGPRESNSPGIQQATQKWLLKLFVELV